MHVGRNRTQQRAGHVHIARERPLLQNGRMVCRYTRTRTRRTRGSHEPDAAVCAMRCAYYGMVMRCNLYHLYLKRRAFGPPSPAAVSEMASTLESIKGFFTPTPS